MTDSNIDFYNIQYYNQGSWAYYAYDSFDKLFPNMYEEKPNSTSIESITTQGVPASKILLGKPVTPDDVGVPGHSTGFLSLSELRKIIRQAQHQHILFGGVMGWKVDSDKNGEWGKEISLTLNASPLNQSDESLEEETVST
ncbi:hypothetical protein, partial [Photobacterium sp. OFAV2-7]|uniref:hypothetical protein n=1 Tax=Photobacterium sp. OFAV2-7 TaxID=2917748 RepID=UPI001EF56E52